MLSFIRIVFNGRMKTLIKAVTLIVLFSGARQTPAQHYLEARGADTKYRYFDWNYTFTNAALVDAFYVGVPGGNEFNLGGGYGFKPKPCLTLAPLAYAVIGKEAGQRGIKIALLVILEKSGWKVNSFLGHFERIAGDVDDYQVLDTLDISRAVQGPFEIGFSSGFFHAGGKWNPQNGPLFKLNDRLGAWYVSCRFGPDNELRFARNFLFK
jgi:hypothetical protein